MVSQNQIISLFKITNSKIVLFIIIFFAIASILFLIPTNKKQKQSVLSSLIPDFIIVKKRKPILSIICFSVSIFLFGVNYLIPQSPSFSHDSIIISGNSSHEISDLNQDRLESISNHLIIVKKSVQMTPSKFDIDDSNVDNNLNYWKTNDVIPFFDVHINSSLAWTWYNFEMYFPNNGIGPISTKHEHDFESFQIFFYQNETTPTYIVFPTFKGLVRHPKVLLKWSEMPKLDDYHVALLLDSETNAFSENYDHIPKSSSNFEPSFIAPKLSDSWDYFSLFDKIQFVISLILIFVFIGLSLKSKFNHHVYFLLILFLCLSALFPLMTLSFDYIGNISFRVFENGEQPDTSTWSNSYSGQIYIEGYGGLPYDKTRWTQPYFSDQIGIY